MVDYNIKKKLLQDCDIIYKCKTHFRGIKLWKEVYKLDFNRYFLLNVNENKLCKYNTYWQMEKIIEKKYWM